MSYSRTYRNSNGVGAYRTNLNEGQNERQGATGSQAEQPQQQETAAPSLERVNRRDGFTMFRPDEKKMAHLTEMARREEEDARAHREARRVQHVHERPARVGGTTGYSTVVKQKQKAVTSASKGLEMQKKREQWQREKREREEKELQEKKAKARAQSERNEALRAVRGQEAMERHRNDHRSKNQEFLDRLERGSDRYNYYQ